MKAIKVEYRMDGALVTARGDLHKRFNMKRRPSDKGFDVHSLSRDETFV
jgi:hypothetical protein